MAKQTLYLCSYDRGKYSTTGKIKPYHWSFFIQIEVKAKKNKGIGHQLRGMPGGFHYDGPENVTDLWKSGNLKETIEIGEVDYADLDKVHEILKGVSIDKSESSGWNCQNWSLEGFAKLQEEGFVFGHLTGDDVKYWLKEETTTMSGASGLGDKGGKNTTGGGSKMSGGNPTTTSSSDAIASSSSYANSSDHASSSHFTASGVDTVSSAFSSSGSLAVQETAQWPDGWYDDPWDESGTTQRWLENGDWSGYTR